MTAIEPPEFDPYGETFFDDPYALYRRLRDERPVFHSERYGFWALSRWDDVVAAHRDWRTFTSTHGVTLDQLAIPAPNGAERAGIICMDPPEHDRMRGLVSRVFTPGAVHDLEPLVVELLAPFLDALDGRAGFDVVTELAGPFPVEVIAALLGVPRADRQQIRHWTDAMLHRGAGDPRPGRQAIEAAVAMGAYFFELARARRAAPAPDMISRLVEAGLDDAEIAGFCNLLGGAGSETVTKLIGNAVVLFDRNREQWDLARGNRELVPGAIEECLRYWPPSQYQGRFSTTASAWHGVEIPGGVPVLLVTGAATRDERRFEEPDRFDITRSGQLQVAFGHGVHSCLGAALARLEARIVLDALMDRYERLVVDPESLTRVRMSNVAGFSSVGVTVG